MNWLRIILPFALKAAGKGIAIGAGSLAAIAAKNGVDTVGAGAINDALIAVGGLVLNDGIDWFQKTQMKKKSENNAAKIEIVAEKTETKLSPGIVADKVHERKHKSLGREK